MAMIPYNPSSAPSTRSRVENSRLQAASLQEGLDLISPESVQTTLSQRFCKAQPSRSILEFLKDPGEGIAAYQAASVVLEELADQTQDTALDCLMVMRYVQTHCLWRGHPNPKVKSAETFLETLNSGKYVYASLGIAAATQLDRRGRIRIIDTAWGPGWFDKIPPSIRQPKWSKPEDCSVGVLTEIAANAKQGLNPENAIEGWMSALDQRTDMGTRRRLGISGPTTPYLLPRDVASLNQGREEADKGRRTSDIYFPDVKDNQLKVEIIPTTSSDHKSSIYNVGNPLRKRKPRVEAVNKDVDGDGWIMAADGRTKSKRVKNHLIRKPVVIPVNYSSEVESEGTVSLPASSPPKDVPPSTQAKCHGPGVAIVLQKIIAAFEDLNPCCDTCRPHVLDARNILLSRALPLAETLEHISDHRMDGGTIPTITTKHISPVKSQLVKHNRAKAHSTIFVADSDDE